MPPPGVLCQRDLRVRYLPIACGTAQLQDGLDDLGEAGGADGMPAMPAPATYTFRIAVLLTLAHDSAGYAV